MLGADRHLLRGAQMLANHQRNRPEPMCSGSNLVLLPDCYGNQNSGLEKAGDRFEYRKDHLPDSYGNQTQWSEKLNYFEDLVGLRGNFGVGDLLPIDYAVVRKGRKIILTPEEAAAVKKGQRRYQVAPDPKAPTIQKLLIQAYNFKARLEDNPLLRRGELAREIGMNPSYLTRVLHLLNLAPDIQRQIMRLKPSIHPGPLTENRIRFLARNPDHAYQISEFNRLKNKKPRVRYRLKASSPAVVAA